MSKKRSIVKSILWELGMFVVCSFIIYLWLNNLSDAIFINFFLLVIKITGLSIYDYVWENKIRWGK